MIGRKRANAMVLAAIGLLVTPVACREESAGNTPRPPGAAATAPTATLPADRPSIAPTASAPAGEPKTMDEVDTSGVKLTEDTLTLTGISFKLPEGWVREDPAMNPQSPGLSRKAQIRLPKTDNEPADAIVAITHFPNMKGPQMDAMNLQRWYGQFIQPDGQPTAELVGKAVFSVGDVALTIVDIPGTMKGGGRGGKPNYRMVAAIVDHAKGPHFVKVTGPNAVVLRWKASVVAFLQSAEVNQ